MTAQSFPIARDLANRAPFLLVVSVNCIVLWLFPSIVCDRFVWP
jgi:hypothetical protein